MTSPAKYEREPYSASGDFYVESKCCTSCGVPIMVAPDLIGYVDEEQQTHCHWKKQPATREELNQAFLIFDGQELGCHRYAGHDPEIMSRIGFDSCDHAPPRIGPFYLSATQSPPREMFLLPVESPGLLRRLWNKLRGD